MKKLSIMSLALFSFALTACGASNTASTTGASEGNTSTGSENTNTEAGSGTLETATGKFTVGFDQEFPPMGFIGDDGEYTGYDLALAKEVADRLGLEFVAQPINWDAKDMELSTGNIDCIWNGFTMQGREDNYTWVGPYMANEQVFVVNADSDIQTLADLSRKVVEVQQDSSGLDAINDEENEELVSSFAGITVVSDYNTALMDLEAGATDAICMDSVVASYQITSSGKDMRILDESLSAEEYGIGFSLGNEELANAVEDALKEMKADGTVDQITNEWFGDASVFTLN